MAPMPTTMRPEMILPPPNRRRQAITEMVTGGVVVTLVTSLVLGFAVLVASLLASAAHVVAASPPAREAAREVVTWVGCELDADIHGLTPGHDGEIATVTNNCDHMARVLPEDEDAIAPSWRIWTAGDKVWAIVPHGTLRLMYSAKVERWVMMAPPSLSGSVTDLDAR